MARERSCPRAPSGAGGHVAPRAVVRTRHRSGGKETPWRPLGRQRVVALSKRSRGPCGNRQSVSAADGPAAGTRNSLFLSPLQWQSSGETDLVNRLGNQQVPLPDAGTIPSYLPSHVQWQPPGETDRVNRLGNQQVPFPVAGTIPSPLPSHVQWLPAAEAGLVVLPCNQQVPLPDAGTIPSPVPSHVQWLPTARAAQVLRLLPPGHRPPSLSRSRQGGGSH